MADENKQENKGENKQENYGGSSSTYNKSKEELEREKQRGSDKAEEST